MPWHGRCCCVPTPKCDLGSDDFSRDCDTYEWSWDGDWGGWAQSRITGSGSPFAYLSTFSPRTGTHHVSLGSAKVTKAFTICAGGGILTVYHRNREGEIYVNGSRVHVCSRALAWTEYTYSLSEGTNTIELWGDDDDEETWFDDIEITNALAVGLSDDPKWIDVDKVWFFDDGHLVSSEEGPIITRIRLHRQAKQPPAGKRYNYVVYFRTGLLGTPTEEEPDLTDEFGIIIRYEDASNFDWVKFELSDTGTSVWPSFIGRAAGIDTVLMDRISHPAGEALTIDDDDTFTGRICFADVEWSVTLSKMPPDTGPGSEPPWTLCGGGAASLPDSPFGFVGFLYGRFDEWAYFDHWETDRDCPRCSCWCEHPSDENDYSCLPEQLMVSFVPQHDPADYSAPRLDGKDFLLKQVAEIGPSAAADLSPAKRRWKAQEEVDGRYHPSASFWLSCLEQLTLKTDFDGVYWSPIASGDRSVDWSESVCRPLMLVFKSIGSSATQCDDGVSIRLEADPTSDCLPDTSENTAFLDGLRWDVIITEVA